MARKSTEFVQFKLRVREGLRVKIEREAKKKDQSANNEAVERLERSFDLSKQENRDAAVVDFLANGDGSAVDWFRWLAFQCQVRAPKDGIWTKEMRENLASEFRNYLVPTLEGTDQ